MQEQIRKVASRIRELREIAGRSPEEAARDLGIPGGAYLAYESGEQDIPIGVLFEIAARYNVELAAILTGENPRLHLFSVVRRGQGPSVERHAAYRYESLAPNFAHKRAEPFLVTVEPAPGGVAEQLNSHPGQEFTYVLSGEVKVVVGGHEVVLGEGDSLYFDASRDHGMTALGDAPARFLAVVL